MNHDTFIRSIFGLVILVVLVSPTLVFCEDIEVLIKGIDDGKRTTKQQDYQEALMNAKLQAIERAGVEITSITKIENFQLKSDTIESRAKSVLLPGFQVMDIGYQADGTYLVILTGKVRSQLDNRKHPDEFENALLALKKINSMVEVGLNYDRYLQALPEMDLAVKLYLESPTANPEIVRLMKSASLHFTNAQLIWRELNKAVTKNVKDIWDWQAIPCLVSAAHARHYNKEQAMEICSRQKGAMNAADYGKLLNVRFADNIRYNSSLASPETSYEWCAKRWERGTSGEDPLCELIFKFYPDLPEDSKFGWGMVGKSSTLSHIWSLASKDIEKLTKFKESSN